MKDIKFISLKNTRKVGNFVLDKNIPLPIQMSKEAKAEDLDINSLKAGLIKLIAWDGENENSEYYRKVLFELQPDIVEQLNLGAIAKSEKKEYEFAIELMLAVNHLCKLPESYVNLAVLYAKITVELHKQGDDVKADMFDDKILDILLECVEEYPDFAPAYSEISAFYTRHGDMEQARDYLEKFVEKSKDSKAVKNARNTLKNMNKMLDSEDRILYAYDKIMMGQMEEAIEVINKYLDICKPTWEAFFLRGWAYRVLENFEKAQIDLLEALKLNPESAEVYNELSICTKETGNVELAKNYLEIACDLDSENIIYLLNLAFLKIQDDEIDDAKQLIDKAREIDPEDPQLIDIIKSYEEKTGDILGSPVKEEIYTDEQLEELHKDSHQHEEI